MSGKIDRVDGDPMGARGIVVDYKSGAASSAAEIRERDLLQLPLYMLVLRDQLGLEPVGGLYMPVGGGRRPRGMLALGPTTACRASARATTSSRSEFDEAIEHGARRPRSGSSSASAAATSATTRRAASARTGATSGGCAARSAREARRRTRSSGRRSTRAATSSSPPAPARARPPCSSSGSSRAVVDDGLDVESLLVITYTERAAGELRARIRSRLLERGRPDLALELDGAWVSTIHGFCRRLLGAYPLAAGVDPGFRVLDEPQALVLQAEAFTTALERFCAADEPDRWQLLATYGAVGLRQMLVEVYATLRSAGPRARARAGRARSPSTSVVARAARGGELPRRRRARDARPARRRRSGARPRSAATTPARAAARSRRR